jgi:hypothetical protein
MDASSRPSTRCATPSGAFVVRYNAEWLIEKNGHRSPLDARAAWLGQTFRRAA